MPAFTVETTYRLPTYRQTSYVAPDPGTPCIAALHDDDWDSSRVDYDSPGPTYVSGLWPGCDTAYQAAAIPIPPEFGEGAERRAEHFPELIETLETLIGQVEALYASDASQDGIECYARHEILERARATHAKALAIMANTPDPVPPPDRTAGYRPTA